MGTTNIIIRTITKHKEGNTHNKNNHNTNTKHKKQTHTTQQHNDNKTNTQRFIIIIIHIRRTTQITIHIRNILIRRQNMIILR